MKFLNTGAEVFVPDGMNPEDALSRTTHMGIGAHHDDLEIMAWHGILECFGTCDQWFAGVVTTNGAGSARNGLYENCPDEQMQKIRRAEQKKAACIGEYGAVVLLDYPSSEVKDPVQTSVKEEIKAIVEMAEPGVVYTHNIADKHDTHVSTALRVISAIRELPLQKRPEKLYGCEVWRDLDWLSDEDKVRFDLSSRQNIAASLLGVFDSQISGGKRYDLATAGRRLANATYDESHGTDAVSSLAYAMDLTPLITDPSIDIEEYVAGHIKRFMQDVSSKVSKFSQ